MVGRLEYEERWEHVEVKDWTSRLYDRKVNYAAFTHVSQKLCRHSPSKDFYITHRFHPSGLTQFWDPLGAQTSHEGGVVASSILFSS
jgi:hypothetical protein